MKNTAILIIAILVSFSAPSWSQDVIYDFKVKDISGNDYPLSQLKGKKILVVNTASECGLTPQYEDLEKLYREYGNEDFVVIGFPANNFAGQEPGSNSEIAAFCTKKFDVTFPMMEKISVKGDDIHPLYQWLTSKEENGLENSKVSWNFQKYMIDENGHLVGHVSPQKKPYNNKILAWITGEEE